MLSSLIQDFNPSVSLDVSYTPTLRESILTTSASFFYETSLNTGTVQTVETEMPETTQMVVNDQVRRDNENEITDAEFAQEQDFLSDYLTLALRLPFVPVQVIYGLLKNKFAGPNRVPVWDTIINNTLGYVFRNFNDDQIKKLVGEKSLQEQLDSLLEKFSFACRGLYHYNVDFSGDGFKARWISETPGRTEDDPILLYVNGGGYNYRTTLFQVLYICDLARILKNDRVSVIVLDYDTAPEAQNPTQRYQGVACIQKILKISNKPILLGDSSGGNVALTSLLETDAIPPKSMFGVALISAATDPLASTGSMNYQNDIFTKNVIFRWMRNWLNGNPYDPKTNPLRYDPSIWSEILPDNVCSVWGECDLLKDQNIAFISRAGIRNYYEERGGTHDCTFRGIKSDGAQYITRQLKRWLRNAN